MRRTGLVRMLCAVSLLLVAFAHKPIVVSATASAYQGAEIADYVLPDGTLPDICLTGEEDGHHSTASHCEACRIVSSVDLPAPFEGFLLHRANLRSTVGANRTVRPAEPVLRADASPRAPPFRIV